MSTRSIAMYCKTGTFVATLGMLLSALALPANAAFLLVGDITTDITSSDEFAGPPILLDDNLQKDLALTVSTDTTGQASGFWLANSETEFLTFDFGADALIEDIVIWNYNSGSGGAWTNGMREFTVSFATDAEGFGALGSSAIPDTASIIVGVATSETAEPGQLRDFSDVTARYVKVNITDGQSSGRVGANEIRFNGVLVSGSVPEPSSVVLAAMGLIGFITRRRRGSRG